MIVNYGFNATLTARPGMGDRAGRPAADRSERGQPRRERTLRRLPRLPFRRPTPTSSTSPRAGPARRTTTGSSPARPPRPSWRRSTRCWPRSPSTPTTSRSAARPPSEPPDRSRRPVSPAPAERPLSSDRPAPPTKGHAMTPARPALDPELRELLADMPLMSAAHPGSARAAAAVPLDARRLPPRRPAVDRREVTVPGPDGAQIPLSVFSPAGTDRATAAPCVYWMHGGGMVMGDRFSQIDIPLDGSTVRRRRGLRGLPAGAGGHRHHPGRRLLPGSALDRRTRRRTGHRPRPDHRRRAPAPAAASPPASP